MINSITLLGSSSGKNAGDAAIIAGIMSAIDSNCGKKIKYEIPTLRPSYIRENYQHWTEPVSMLPWSFSAGMFGPGTYNSIMRTDLSLIFDNMLFDRSLYNPVFNYLWTVALFLPLAKKRGKLLGMYDVGVGPIGTKKGLELLKTISDSMDFITVRDQESMNILQEIKTTCPNISLTADAALNLQPSSKEKIDALWQGMGLKLDEEVLCINVSKYIGSWAGKDTGKITKEEFTETYAGALKKFLDIHQVPVLFVCTQHHDVEITKMLMEKLDRLTNSKVKLAIFTNQKHNHHDIQGILGRVGLICAMRLHAMILSASLHSPIMGLPHQPKVEYFLRRLGLEKYCIKFDSFSEGALFNGLNEAWNDRFQIRSILDKEIPGMKQQALLASEIVAKLDRGEEPTFSSAVNQ